MTQVQRQPKTFFRILAMLAVSTAFSSQSHAGFDSGKPNQDFQWVSGFTLNALTAAVPEPSSILTTLLGASGLGFMHRKRRRAKTV
jgi:hypothetical protein